jgi:hypothetical protein
MLDKTAIRIIKKYEDKSDFAFWQTQSYEARLKALESIREEYNNWKYGLQQRFQRVYRVTKRK